MQIAESQFLNNANDGKEFFLPELEYGYDALNEFIDAQTMEIHHTKHHNAYITKLNAALEGNDDLKGQSVESLLQNLSSMPENLKAAIQNQGGGHANHCLFWQVLATESSDPSVDLLKAIEAKYTNLDNCLAELNKAATTVFGSGWGWITVNAQGEINVTPTRNQDNPLSIGEVPIFGIDVWEHAYYLKYQNRRPDYVGAVLKNINWANVSARYEDALKVVKATAAA